MSITARIAVALALSLAAAGLAQQAIMAIDGAAQTLSALPPLGAGIVLIAAVFSVVAWRSRTASGIGRTAAALLAVMLAVGLAALAFGYLTISPGIAGGLLYGLAIILDLYFLLPAALAVAIHWWLLRGAARS
jgi:hypothetical protein